MRKCQNALLWLFSVGLSELEVSTRMLESSRPGAAGLHARTHKRSNTNLTTSMVNSTTLCCLFRPLGTTVTVAGRVDDIEDEDERCEYGSPCELLAYDMPEEALRPSSRWAS